MDTSPILEPNISESRASSGLLYQTRFDGICVRTNSKLLVTKAVGSTENLSDTNSRSPIGIGHTRWATHGEVTIDNAHPHLSNCSTVSIVHNGIIENADILKSRLKNFKFKSDTDSEILANLIASHYIGDLTKAVQVALKEVRGSYGIAVLHKDHPNTIVCAKYGSPICIGVGDKEICVASDATALPLDINKVAYLDDNQIATIKGKTFTVIDSDKVVNPELNKLACHRGTRNYESYSCFLEKEIHEQPVALENAMRGRFSKDHTYVKFGGIKLPKKVRRVVFLGCGTAYHAGNVGKYYMENID